MKEKEDYSDLDFKNKVEALLFGSGKKLEVEFLRDVSEAKNVRPIKKALAELKHDYDERGGALMIVQEGNAWKIHVREKYNELVREIISETELSMTVMETLAVIAWKSPVMQSEVIHIRTSKAYEHIGDLLEAGFLTKEKQGRSFILRVTEKFYTYFDVEGAEGIREVFSKIKEKPVQKKVDEYKDAIDESETERLGKLEVVDAEPDQEESQEDSEDLDEADLEETAKAIAENDLSQEDKDVL